MKYTETIRKLLPPPIRYLIQKVYSKSEKLIKYFDWINTTLDKKYQGISNDVTPSLRKNFYDKSINSLEPGNKIQQIYSSLFEINKSSTDLQKMQYVDMKTWLPDDLLLKADKMTMAASIELRVPFLDHRIVEFGYSLPDDYKIHLKERKYILKKLMEKSLPHNILYQKKKGFPTPISKWFREGLFDKIQTILMSSRSMNRGYYNTEYIQSILLRHRTGKEDHSRRILSLLVIELWHQKFIDSDCVAKI